MKIETQPKEDCTLELTVEVEEDRVQPALRAAARRLSKQYKIPGFRPGKAPYETVVRHVGEGAIYGEALEDLGQKVYQEVLDQEKIDAFAPGELEDVQFKPMVLKFSVPLRPEVDLGDYRSVRVEYTPPQVSDEAVQEAMEHLREHQAELAPVERPAALGDAVTLDVKAYLNEGENPSDFLMADDDVQLLLDENGDWPMPGFAQQVVGMSAGDERKFDLTFGDDYPNTSLRGQAAHFEVKAKEVKQRTLPEWNDELAKSLGDYENVDALRAKVREDLENQARVTTDREYADKVVDAIVAQATVKYPPVLLRQELDEMLDDIDRRLREQRLTLDDYLTIEGKTREQYREELTPQAQERLKRTLVLGKVVDVEGLDVSDADVDQQIETMSAPWGERADQMRQALSGDRARRMISLDLLTDKAIARLVAIAKGEDVPPAAEEAQTEPAAEAQAEASPVAAAEDKAEANASAEAEQPSPEAETSSNQS